jgi:hypothetical protein
MPGKSGIRKSRLERARRDGAKSGRDESDASGIRFDVYAGFL